MSAARAAAIAIACTAVGASALLAVSARAQRVDPKRARTIVVGAPRGASPADRVDGARSGESRAPLPTGTLHVAWRRSLGLPVDAAPVIDARGDVTVVAARGDVVVFAADGEERAHTVVGSAAAGGPALLSDGTAVFLTSQGDAVGVRLGDVRFRAHLGGGRSSVSPLPLDDGGFVVATQAELVSLDGEGNVRARAAVDAGDPPEDLVGPLLTADGPTVYAVTGSGAVLAWVPAAGREAARVASFGGAIDGGAALINGNANGPSPQLVAVVGASQLVAVDPIRGTSTTRAAAGALGALVLLGPPAVSAARGGAITILASTATSTLAVTFDAAGAESARERAGDAPFDKLPDGGVPFASALPPHLGPIVDGRGAVAFALVKGELGVVAASGAVDLVGDVCARFGSASPLAALGTRPGPTFTGLIPAGPSAVVFACGSGVVGKIESDFAHPP